jgi:hypothetical protein
MAKTKTEKNKTKEERVVEKEERHRRLLERLGMLKMMFDFYTAPVA